MHWSFIPRRQARVVIEVSSVKFFYPLQGQILCRALVEIFNHPDLKDDLAFRGGTALFKLHLTPLRYSEDIDLVQVHAGPIGPAMSALQERLNPWLGIPKRKQGEGRMTLTCRMTSKEGAPQRQVSVHCHSMKAAECVALPE